MTEETKITQIELDAVKEFIEMIDLVEGLVIDEYIGIAYEGWMRVHQSKIPTSYIIQAASNTSGWTESEIAIAMLDALADMNKEYAEFVESQKSKGNIDSQNAEGDGDD